VALGVARPWPNSVLSIERPTGPSCFDGRPSAATSSKFVVDDSGSEESGFKTAEVSLDDPVRR